ncbi:thioesterase domain-containing protein [Oceanobacter mangrovi]|uniref:thioesterase domain-containing protein n=1 Tax=Oceanobacter mangrovi TaxID=2862510 RepID=UPI001C8D0E0D|nr:thioesterase domain-containing protein [Oceanobacter mangrovi]
MTAIWHALPSATAKLGSNEGAVYYWLPGWSFSADIFAAISQQLPGQHYGLDYRALWAALQEKSATADFAAAVELISSSPGHTDQQQTAQSRPAHWIGWSLGGALAQACCSQLANKPQAAQSLTVLATGNRFLQQQAGDSGMASDTFEAFCAGFDKLPAKTLKRFLMLCCQGADNAKNLASELAQFQLPLQNSDESSNQTLLATTLQWLTQYDLNQQYPLQNLTDSAVWYASSDALTPGDLQAKQLANHGQSHAAVLEADLQDALIQRLQLLAGSH